MYRRSLVFLLTTAANEIFPGVKIARVAQLVMSALTFNVKVKHGVLVISRATKPAGVREMGPKLGEAGVAFGTAVIVLFAKVTSPF